MWAPAFRVGAPAARLSCQSKLEISRPQGCVTRPSASRHIQHGLAGGNLEAAGMTTNGPDLPRRVTTHAPSERLSRHGCPAPAAAAHQHGQSAFRIKLLGGQWDLTRPGGNSSSASGRQLPSFFSAGVSRRAGRPAGAIRVTRQTAAKGYTYRPTQGPGHWRPPVGPADDVQDCKPEPRPTTRRARAGPAKDGNSPATHVQRPCNNQGNGRASGLHPVE